MCLYAGGSTLTKLIIINGAPGVGKSTVGSLLLSKLNNSAFLDGDSVWRINPFEVNEKTKNIVDQNIAFVLRNYIEAGYEYVILAWVLHRQTIIDRLLSKLNDFKLKVYVFTLVADEETLVDRVRADAKTQRDHEIAKDRLRQSLELRSKKLDTTVLEPDEIVDVILEAVTH
jgi:predicted ABC-type ATPase